MQRSGRHIINGLLLSLSMMPALFGAFILLQEIFIRHAMLERMEYASLKSIRLQADKIKWHRQDSEIILDGRLFDVKTITRNGNVICLSGLFDDEETSLRDKVMHLYEEENQGKSKILVIHTFFTQPALEIRQVSFHDSDITSIQTPLFFSANAAKPKSAYLKLISPPPES